MFVIPFAAHASASSAIVDEGVMGKIAHTSLTRYAIWAAAVLPSMTIDLADIPEPPESIYARTANRAGTVPS
jgi:hypothetical protein